MARTPPVDPQDPASARRAAVSLLARRDYASGELRGRLEKKGFDHTIVDSTILELVEERVLDDARYAANYVSYHAGRGEGPVRIKADLQALGLPDDLIGSALAAGPDWRALAREVRLRRFGAAEPADSREKLRHARFLQYRGFSSDHIRSVIDADFDLD
jgi:regulatory protein